ncbi:type II toxin-antitoxin system RelB/DinJ family antitoxin [Clostridium phoceensis]|uniref:type II toxin-antitoxin system RelB/DinJ family antitoxin n=1 Tax=Clostridium phoceensis TaxID=1650661 RepID=UPI002E79C28D|nr:type II toxin-antitoxin system RelB/DinJ family antitoxin [Clostridium phoceensis]
MATTNMNIRTDVEVKAAAEQLFNELGLNLTTAVNMFLRQAIRTGGIPFDIKVNTPNEITAAAIAEGKRMMQDKTAKGYHSMEDLKAALDA